MPEPRIRRRTIVKGAAWSLPVIALAAAVPAATASGVPFACPSQIRPAVVINQLDSSDWNVFLARAWWTLSSKYFGIDTTSVDPAVYGTTFTFTLLGGTQFTMSNGGQSTAPWYPSFSTFTGAVGTVTPLPPVDGTIGQLNSQVVADLYDPNSGVDVSIDAADAYTPSAVQFTAELQFTSPTTGETVTCIQDFTFVIQSAFSGGPVVNGHGHLQLAGTVGV